MLLIESIKSFLNIFRGVNLLSQIRGLFILPILFIFLYKLEDLLMLSITPIIHFHHFIQLSMSFFQTLMDLMINLRQSFYVLFIFVLAELHDTVIIIYLVLLVGVDLL